MAISTQKLNKQADKVKGVKSVVNKAKKKAIKASKQGIVAMHQILTGIIETEKSTLDKQLGKYYFKINQRSNKKQIKKAIEAYWGVTVEKVNILNYQPKKKSFKMNQGRTNSFKKAVVTLKEGDKINI